MTSSLKGPISYQMLQRMLEAAWDADDMQRLLELSRSMDQYAAEAIGREIQKEITL